MKVAQVVTVPYAARVLMRGWLQQQVCRGVETHLITSPGEDLEHIRASIPDVRIHTVRHLRREISLFDDVRALARLVQLLRREKFDIVHVSTPKASLITLLASTSVPASRTVYTVRGLPLETQYGPMRRFSLWSEWLNCRLADRVVAISPSLKEEMSRLRLCRADRIKVFGHGSSNGVDPEIFSPAEAFERLEVRARLVIPEGATVIGFVARAVIDKGIDTLWQSWSIIRELDPQSHLLVVGREEVENPLPADLRTSFRTDPRVRWLEFSDKIRREYSAMDIVVLPSKREGFGNVLLEAGCMGIPVIATDVTGCVDAVIDGETGFLVQSGDVAALADRIMRLAKDRELRERLGGAGRRRAMSEFSPAVIWDGILELYFELDSGPGYRGARR